MEFISIVIPTFKQKYLKDTLDSCLRQTNKNFEILVYENGFKSSETAELVKSYQQEMDIRYYFDENGGVNRARNNGTLMTKYSIIALIDQDIILGERWVESALMAHNKYPNAGIIGGKVDLHFIDENPGWIIGDFARKLSAVDYGNDISILGGYHFLIGGNMSYRKDLFEKIGGFYEKSDSEFFFNNELTFHEGVKKYSNPALVYIPEMSTKHQIPGDRTTLEYMIERFYQQGICDIAYHKFINKSWTIRSLFSVMEFEMYCEDDFKEMKKNRDSLSTELSDTFTINFFTCRMAYLSGLKDGINKSYKKQVQVVNY